jgi:predicted dehydrogenase
MKGLVAGLGSIARRHIENLKEIAPDIELAVWRQQSHCADLQDIAPLVDHVVFDLADALAWRADFALVTNPASLHVQTGLALAQEGMHLFIEKPLSDSLEGVDELLDLCRERSLVLMTGYNFRFCRSLQALRQTVAEGRIGRVMSVRAEVGQFLPEWRPGSDYRQGVSATSALGGGALLELSHELDYVRWLVGEVETVQARIGQLSDLEIAVEDTAEIVLQFANGAIGSVHLDMVQRSTTRTCRVIGTEGTLTWDGLRDHSQLFSAKENAWSDLCPANTDDRNEMYVGELRHFLDCVAGGVSPAVDGEDGRRVLEIVVAARLSSIQRREIEL